MVKANPSRMKTIGGMSGMVNAWLSERRIIPIQMATVRLGKSSALPAGAHAMSMPDITFEKACLHQSTPKKSILGAILLDNDATTKLRQIHATDLP